MNPRWRDLALCREVDPHLFFPDPGGQARAARRVCAACDVRTDCLTDVLAREHGLTVKYRSGVYGGLTPEQRHHLDRSNP